MKRSLCKNSFLPEEPPHGGDSIREGRLGFRIPLCLLYAHTVTTRMLSEDQANDTKQTQQTRSHAQHRVRHILSRRLKSQVSTDFLKSRFNGPTRGKPAYDLGAIEARIRRIEIFVPVRALAIYGRRPSESEPSPHRLYTIGPFR